MTTDLENTVQYYRDLLLYQYINAPKACATIDLLVSQALVDLLPIAVNAAFDIETATGTQLDILGEYIGFDRYVVALVPRDYFVLDEYITGPANHYGLTTYADAAANIAVSMSSYVVYLDANFALEDEEYRLLLKLTILLNQSQNSTSEIASTIYTSFGAELVMSDQRDMSISYFVTENIARIVMIARDESLLPKPMGVHMSGLFQVEDYFSLWGLTDYIEDMGFDVGLSTYSGWTDAYVLEYTDRI